MTLDYTSWNNLLGNHFFNPNNNGKEIYLYTSKSIIVQIFRLSSYYDSFLEKLIESVDTDAALQQNEIDDEVWESFCKALKKGVQSHKGQYKAWFEKATDCWQVWEVRKQNTLYGQSIDCPLYFAYLVAMVIPLTENEDDFSGNNYYDRVLSFLKTNGCLTAREIQEYDQHYESFKTSFSNQFRTIDYYWQGLANWSVSFHKGAYGVFKVKTIGNFKHVGKPFAECIITAQQRQLIPLLFEKAELQVGARVPDSTFEKLVSTQGHQLLRYTGNKWNTIASNNDLRLLLVNIVKEAYASWDGIVRPKPGIERHVNSDQSVLNVYLSMTVDLPGSNLQEFGFRFFQPSPEDYYDDMEFAFQAQRITNLSFYYNGWAKNKTELPDRIENILDMRVIYQDKVNRLKAIHTPSNIYLFSTQPSLTGFTSKSTLSYTDEYYLLYKDAIADVIEPWLETCLNHKKLNHFNNIPKGWFFSSFKDARSSCPGIPLLTLPNKVIIEKIKGLKIEGNTFLKYWPVQFLVSGLKHNEELYSITENGIKTPLEKRDGEWYEVNPATYSTWKKYKLETNLGFSSGSWYRFQDFDMPQHWQEPLLDKFGFADFTGQGTIPVKGLHVTQLPETYPIAHSQLYYSSLAEEEHLPAIFGTYTFDDKLLYSIANKAIFDLPWFAKAYELCACNRGLQSFGSKEVKSTLYLYHQLGFLNYEYQKEQGKHWITLNRPTLLNLPMKVAESPHYKVLLTGARTPALMQSLIDYCNATPGIHLILGEMNEGSHTRQLLPQSVTLKARTREIFSAAASALGIDYQPTIYYPLSLVKHTPRVAELHQYLPSLCLREWQDYTMTKRVIDTETLQLANTTDDIDTSLNLVEYYPGTYQAINVLWQNHIAYEIDKNWGKYYILYLLNQRQVLKYDVRSSELFVPVSFRLPKIFARALCLMSGEAPGLVNMEGQLFQVYRIPGQLEWNILHDKLNQRNHI